MAISITSLSSWLTIYQEGDVTSLKVFEIEPINKYTRDNTYDAKKLETLTEEYNELLASNKDMPNTLKRCEALMKYYRGGRSQESIAKEFKVSKATFNSWVSMYDNFEMEGLISREPYRLSKEYSDGEYKEELFKTLKKEYKTLIKNESEANRYPDTIKIAKALILYLKNKKSQDEAAKKLGVSRDRFKSFLKVFIKEKLEGIKIFEMSKPNLLERRIKKPINKMTKAQLPKGLTTKRSRDSMKNSDPNKTKANGL